MAQNRFVVYLCCGNDATITKIDFTMIHVNTETAIAIKTILNSAIFTATNNGALMQWESDCNADGENSNELIELGMGDTGEISDSVDDLFDTMFEIID